MIAIVHAKPLAAVVLSLSLLAACGGGGDDDGGASTTAAADVDADVAVEEALLTPADLDTGNDLDAGWEIGDVSAGVDIALPDCITEERDADAVGSAETKLVTKNDLKLPSLEQYVGTYESGGAEAAFQEASARLDACQPEFVFQGTPSTGATERLPLTLEGDQSAAWRTTVTIAGSGVAITSIHVVDGDVELALVHVDLGAGPEPALLESYVAKAVAKLG